MTEEIKRDSKGLWLKGQSGNPKGSKSRAEKLLESVSDMDLAAIMDAMVKKAMDGDTTAASIVLDRFAAKLKQVEQSTTITADSEIKINVTFPKDGD